MIPDLSSVFSRYESLRNEVDSLFARVSGMAGDCVTCKEGCSDCCHALFDLSLVEAMYVQQAFEKAFDYGPQRSDILTRASETDRQLTRIKRELFRAEKDGESPESIMEQASKLRLPCPLLTTDKRCALYEARPITCRLYGIPTAIGGTSHVCGLSAFARGDAYPTVQLDKIQSQLEALSREIAVTVKSRFSELGEIYVPLSMALLTRYDEAFLGIGDAGREE